MAGLVKSAELRIFASDGDVQEKLDAIAAKVDELKADNPELVARIDTAAASAKLQVLRDELKETAAAAGETGDEVMVAGDKMDTAGDKGAEGGAKLEGAWKVTKYALLGVGGALVYGIVKAASFQQQMTMLHTQAGVATSSLKGLGAGVLTLAGQVGDSPDSLAESLYHVESNFESLGITAPKALDLVKVAAQGARIGNADLVDVTNALTAAVASGIPGVQNFSQAMGALNSIVGAGDMKMQDLAEAFGTGMVAVVKGYGLSLKDVGAALDVFGDNNIRGAKAGTDLRMAVQALAVPVATGAADLAKLGLNSQSLATTMRNGGLLPALEELTTKFRENGITAKEQGEYITAIFGKKAGAGLAVLLDQMDRLKSKYPAITKGAHDFGAAWGDTQKTVTQQMKDLEMGSEALVTSLGSKLLPVALKVVHWLSGFVEGLEKGSAGATTLAAVIGVVLAGVALDKLSSGISGAIEGVESLGRGFAQVGGWIGGMVGKMGLFTAATEEQAVATEGATGAQEGLDVAMDANPIGAIILGITLLVGAFIYLWTHFKGFRDFWKDAWHDIETAAVDAWHFIDNDLIHPFVAGISLLVDFVKSHWQLLATIIGTVLLGPIAGLVIFIATHWQQVKDLTSRLITDVTGFFERLPGDILHALGNIGSLLIHAGESLIDGLLSGIKSAVGGLLSFVGGIAHDISSVFSSVLHILSPSKVFEEHGRNIVRGLVNGIDGESATATAAMRRLAGGLNLSGAGGSGAAGGGAMELTLTFQPTGNALLDAIGNGLKGYVRAKGGAGPNSVQRALGQAT